MLELLKKFWKEFKQNIKKDIKKEAPNAVADGIISLIFYHRHQTPIKHYFLEKWFKDLQYQKELFRVNNNILQGSYFYQKGFDKDKIIIFACGYGKGYHYYLDFIYALTMAGYLVFTYDNTATDASEGKGIKGFPQAIIDLEFAIEFVKKDRDVKDEDLILIGHSSGGYAVGAIAKDHQNIPKIVLISAFDSGSDLLKQNGREWAHEEIKPYIKYIDKHQERNFGNYSRYTVSKSMRYSHGEFLDIQSDSDLLVPLATGMNVFKKKMKNWKRLSYIKIKDKGHDDILYTNEGIKYRKEVYKKYASLQKGASVNKPTKENLQLLESCIDNGLYLYSLDKNLVKSIITFINKPTTKKNEKTKRLDQRVRYKEIQ